MGISILAILQMNTLRPREAKELVLRHGTSEFPQACSY